MKSFLSVINKQWPAVLLIIIVAGFFRLYHLPSAPPGLYHDEAIDGNDAVEALESGHFRIFYPDNYGRERLFINLVAGSIALFGKQPWAIRSVPAFAGILTVWGTYLLAKELFNHTVACFSSFLLAVSFWHVNFSRIGFRVILAPLMLVFALYFLWRGLGRGRLLDFGLSGLFWGLGLHTYLAFRIAPVAAVITLVACRSTWGADNGARRKSIASGLALLAVVAALVALPLVAYFWRHPDDFFARAKAISVFTSESPAMTLLLNTVFMLGMFNFAGDPNCRHNLADAPMLLWPVGILFAAGLLRAVVILVRSKKATGRLAPVPTLLLSLFLTGLLPAILSTEGIPHALRSILVVPVVYMLAGSALEWLSHFAEKFRPQKWAIRSAVAVLMVIIAVVNFDKYFRRWAGSPATATCFQQEYVNLARKLNSMPREIDKYVFVGAPGLAVNGIPMPAQTVMFLTDTATPKKQIAHGIFYVTDPQRLRRIKPNAFVAAMD